MRAAVGGWIVVLVLTGVLAGGALFGTGAPGSAVRQSPAPPPAVGACVVEVVYLAPTIIPCDRPHQGEIVLAWTGRLPDHDLPLPVDGDADEPSTHCAAATTEHLGLGVPVDGITWALPQLTTLTGLVRGPGPSYEPDWSWSACVVSTTDDYSSGPRPMVGTLRHLLSDPQGPRPAWTLSCFMSVDNLQAVPCDGPHRVEQVGAASVPGSLEQMQAWESAPDRDSVTDPVVLEQCRKYVDRYLGDPGDVHADVLEPVVTYRGPTLWITPDANEPAGGRFDCSVRVVGDLVLTDTVNDIGTALLPVQ